jgi:pyruvate kinase
VRRAKIVCTFGPATATPERVRELVEAGLDVARLNLSHGTHAEHERIFQMIREAAEESGRGVGILVDLQGPKIRLGKFAEGSANLVYGDRFVISTKEVDGDATRAFTTYEGLPQDVRPGDRILVDDGRLVLDVEEVTDTDVVTRVVVGGRVSDHKGLNLPGVGLSVPALSEKDVDDLRWALNLRVDMVALSFVRSASDIDDVLRIMDEERVRLPVIAKIEKPQAVQNLPEIIDAFDGFMVARGDLGVEMPLEKVPLVQKRIVELARTNAKPVIVATQMLESMVNAPRPTRAEASDVANAVLDGTDAVMLSGETSVGMYPVEAVRTMARIIETTEEHGLERVAPINWEPRTKGGVIAKAATEVAERLGAKYLVAFTQSGDSARRVARHRSRVPLLAFTTEELTRNQLALTWGVETFLVPSVSHTDEMVKQVDRALLALGRCRRGDTVVIVAGNPPGVPGSTNALRVHRIGDAVSESVPGYQS